MVASEQNPNKNPPCCYLVPSAMDCIFHIYYIFREKIKKGNKVKNTKNEKEKQIE